MITFPNFQVFALILAFTYAVEDGKYRPTEVTTRIIPTTIRPLITPTTRQPCVWPYDRCEPYDRRHPSFDNRYNPHYDPRYDQRYPEPSFNARFDPRINNRNPWDRTPPRHYHDRPIRLEEKIDDNGYSYKYETAHGVIAEEKGVFENLAIRTPYNPMKVQGFVSIKEYGTEVMRMDYTVVSRDGEFVRRLPRGPDDQRVPTAISRVLELMEKHA